MMGSYYTGYREEEDISFVKIIQKPECYHLEPRNGIFDGVDKFFKYLDQKKSSNVAPHTKYMLHCLTVPKGVAEIDKFWSRCGTWITSLVVHKCFFHDVEKLRPVLYSEVTPNLQSLSIVFQKGSDDVLEMKEPITNFSSEKINKNLTRLDLCFHVIRLHFDWQDLLAHYPNLEDLTIDVLYKEEKCPLEGFLQAVCKLRQEDKSKLSLKKLNARGSYGDLRVTSCLNNELLRKCELPLTSLAVELNNETKEDWLHDLIAIHGSTLQILELYGASDKLCFQATAIPCNSSLRELKVFGKIFQSLVFLQHLQSLESLIIICESNGQGAEDDIVELANQEMTGIFLSSMKNLKLNISKHLTVSNLIKLKNWMPNLEKLDTNLTKDTSSWVRKNWTALKKSKNARKRQRRREINLN